MFRATKISIYMRLMRRMGVSSKRLLSGTDVDWRRVADRDYLISIEQYRTIVNNMIRLSGNTGIGFALADMVTPSDLGIVGYALMSSNSLRQALHVWMEYSNSLLGSSLRLELIRDTPGGYTLAFTAHETPETMLRFEIEELLSGMRMIPLLTGVMPVVRSVCFAYRRPAHGALYDEFFRCPVTFDAKRTVLDVKSPNLDVPVRTGNDELYDVCARHCLQVMRALPQGSLVRSRLRTIFLGAPGKLPDLDNAALKLGMTERSLRRHLDARGMSYQGLKDEFRFDLACEYLHSGHLAPKAVAHLLGYAGPSAFSRAFKSWTGQSVGQYLEQTAEKSTKADNGRRVRAKSLAVDVSH